jgi:hypothetical protein
VCACVRVRAYPRGCRDYAFARNVARTCVRVRSHYPSRKGRARVLLATPREPLSPLILSASLAPTLSSRLSDSSLRLLMTPHTRFPVRIGGRCTHISRSRNARSRRYAIPARDFYYRAPYIYIYIYIYLYIYGTCSCSSRFLIELRTSGIAFLLRLRLKTKQERTLYSSPLGHSVSRKTSSLISLTRDSRSSQFFTRGLDATRAPFDSSKNSAARDVLNFKTFHLIARKQSPEHSNRPIAAYFCLIGLTTSFCKPLSVSSFFLPRLFSFLNATR